MEAVGSEVFVVVMPIIIVFALVAYTSRNRVSQFLRKAQVYVFGQQHAAADPVNHHPAFGADQCSICLEQPKKFEVAGTCGHSFCSQCLFTIYERTHQKIACPLCRKPITTMFRSFEDGEAPERTREQIITKIRQYNSRFDDNRPLIRRIQELPYVLKRVARHMARPMFWILFIRSMYFFKVLMAAIFYLILPIDLVPEKMFGLVGFIDDLIIFGFLILVGVALFVPLFIRNHF